MSLLTCCPAGSDAGLQDGVCVCVCVRACVLLCDCLHPQIPAKNRKHEDEREQVTTSL